MRRDMVESFDFGTEVDFIIASWSIMSMLHLYQDSFIQFIKPIL